MLQGLRRACQINPNGVATIDGDRRQTWSQFRDRVARFAGVLRAAGVQPGDRVAILALNATRISNISTRRRGPARWSCRSTRGWRRRSWSRSSTTPVRSALVIDETFAAMLPALMPGLTSVRSRVRVGGGAAAGRLRRRSSAAIAAADPIDAADPAAVQISTASSTPAAPPPRPRACMLSHGNIVANAMNMMAEVPFEPGHHLSACGADVSPRRLLGDVLADDGRRHAHVRAALRSGGGDADDSGSPRHELDPRAGDDRHARQCADDCRLRSDVAARVCSTAASRFPKRSCAARSRACRAAASFRPTA